MRASQKKTAVDYRKITKPEGEKPIKKIAEETPLKTSTNGINYVSLGVICISVLIIAFLVLKVNTLSKEVASRQNDTEAVTQLDAKVRQLMAKNTALEGEIKTANEEIERLSRENQDLASSSKTGGTDADGDAPAVTETTAEAKTYTVKSGDTLWKISQENLGDGNLYMKIAQENNMDPKKALIAGTKLKIPKKD